ncbi:1915_t:CDS:2, partial [Cetraspora pellucida]
MLTTQSLESMNKLLKRFFDSKTMLSDFLVAFEQALDACEEAEHIFAYKELVYPTQSISQNLIKNQAANYLSELELVKDYINFYNHSQPQALETSTVNESFNPDKCADFIKYLEKYLEALYFFSGNVQNPVSSKYLIINNLIKSKAVRRPKKGRIRCEKENVSVKKKRSWPKKILEENQNQIQDQDENLRYLQN